MPFSLKCSSCPPHKRTHAMSSPGHGENLFIHCLFSERSLKIWRLLLQPYYFPLCPSDNGPARLETVTSFLSASSLILLVGSKWSESHILKTGSFGHIRFTSHQESHWRPATAKRRRRSGSLNGGLVFFTRYNWSHYFYATVTITAYTVETTENVFVESIKQTFSRHIKHFIKLVKVILLFAVSYFHD